MPLSSLLCSLSPSPWIPNYSKVDLSQSAFCIYPSLPQKHAFLLKLNPDRPPCKFLLTANHYCSNICVAVQLDGSWTTTPCPHAILISVPTPYLWPAYWQHQIFCCWLMNNDRSTHYSKEFYGSFGEKKIHRNSLKKKKRKYSRHLSSYICVIFWLKPLLFEIKYRLYVSFNLYNLTVSDNSFWIVFLSVCSFPKLKLKSHVFSHRGPFLVMFRSTIIFKIST